MAPRHVVLGLAAAMALIRQMAATKMSTEIFTNNAVCRKRYCINPVFPGMADFNKLAEVKWVCSTHLAVKPYLDFCSEHVNYQPALPSPTSAQGSPITTLVQKMEEAAATTFFYHLNAMGYDAWEYEDKSKIAGDSCIKAVQRMSCFTYFPRAQAGCQQGGATAYQKPCASCCYNYLKQCGVECCDESAQCIFEHTTTDPASNTSLVTSGYASQLGPSAFCTGDAGRGLPRKALLGAVFLLQAAASGLGSPFSLPGSRTSLVGLLAAVALGLQGCTSPMDIPVHDLGNWRRATDYLVAFEFIPPGKAPSEATINSCKEPVSAAVEQCSGHGYCAPFKGVSATVGDQTKRLAFCKCDDDWADPECRTRRKSQVVAFLWSMFAGFLGADMFYLGYHLVGTLKFMTLGGCGVWWLFDVIRIGCSPVYAFDYRVTNDLSHWIFVIVMMTFLSFVGFTLSLILALKERNKKRRMALQRQVEEEWVSYRLAKEGAARGASTMSPGAMGPGAYGTAQKTRYSVM